MNERILRDAVAICAGLAAAAWAVWPQSLRAAGGVLGGGLLVGLSAWAIRGAVDGVLGAAAGQPSVGADRRRGPRPRALVKIFTRHGILALAAYGMMVRLHLDPVGLLVGVSAVIIAAGVEAVRRLHQAS